MQNLTFIKAALSILHILKEAYSVKELQGFGISKLWRLFWSLPQYLFYLFIYFFFLSMLDSDPGAHAILPLSAYEFK